MRGVPRLRDDDPQCARSTAERGADRDQSARGDSGPAPAARLPHGRRPVPHRGRRQSHAVHEGSGIGWSEYRLDNRFEKVQADTELAALFECEPGERLLARHFVLHDNDQPTQMSTSYVRWSDAAGTPVADPINEPWPGSTRAQMISLRINVTRITESFTAAMPTEIEAATLRIGAGVPVIRYTRRHIADTGRVVEVE